MPKTISDVEERYKERLIASVFQNLNAALPHIERYYDDWNWRNEEVISPAELLNESWEDIFAFLSGEVPQKYLDDNPEHLSDKENLITRAVQDLNERRGRDRTKLIEQKSHFPSSI